MNLDRLRYLIEGETPDGTDCSTPRAELGNGYAIEAETAILLYGLVRRFAPRRVVQTGTHRGYSACWIAAALADTHELYPNRERGRLWTIDGHPHEGDPERHLSATGLSDYVTLATGDSRTTPLPDDFKPIDFLYLDADHSAESVIAEWRNLAPCLNRDEAIVAFHDTKLDPREAQGVREILQQQMFPLCEYQHHGWLSLRNMRGIDFFHLRREVPSPPPYPY